MSFQRSSFLTTLVLAPLGIVGLFPAFSHACPPPGCHGSGYSPAPVVQGYSPRPVQAVQDPVEDTAPARITVNLPADAQLYLDGYLTHSTSGTRVLSSPPLAVGENFKYTLRAEVVRDGETLSVSRKVSVTGGGNYTVSLFPREERSETADQQFQQVTPVSGQEPADSQPQFRPTPASVGGGQVTTSTSGAAPSFGNGTFSSGGTTMSSQPSFNPGAGLFTLGGMGGNRGDFTPGAGGNTGPGSYALINGQKVFIPAGGHLNQMGGPSGGFGNRPSGNFGGHRR